MHMLSPQVVPPFVLPTTGSNNCCCHNTSALRMLLSSLPIISGARACQDVSLDQCDIWKHCGKQFVDLILVPPFFCETNTLLHSLVVSVPAIVLYLCTLLLCCLNLFCLVSQYLVPFAGAKIIQSRWCKDIPPLQHNNQAQMDPIVIVFSTIS